MEQNKNLQNLNQQTQTASQVPKVENPSDICEIVREIPLDLIDPPKEQVRAFVDEEELNQLTESIRLYGQREPIKLKKIGERYEIVDGYMRYLALQKAGKLFAKAIIRNYTPEEEAIEKVHSNIARVTQDPIGEANYYFLKIQQWSVTPDELAERLKLPASRVRSRLELLGYPKDVLDAIKKNELSLAAAKWLAKVPNPEVRKMLIHWAVESGITAEQAKRWYEEYKDYSPVAPPPKQEEFEQKAVEIEEYMLEPCKFCGQKVKREDWAYGAGHKECVEQAIQAFKVALELELQKKAEEEKKKEQEKQGGIT